MAVTDSGRVYVVRHGRLYAVDEGGERVHPDPTGFEAVAVLPTGELAVAEFGRLKVMAPW